jgi:hypothetical protein
MPGKRIHFTLSDDLLNEIDVLAGARGRSAFFLEAARTEVRRRNLLQSLESKGPARNETVRRAREHPGLAKGADARSSKMRNTRSRSKRGPGLRH